jgi:hypothetical protein
MSCHLFILRFPRFVARLESNIGNMGPGASLTDDSLTAEAAASAALPRCEEAPSHAALAGYVAKTQPATAPERQARETEARLAKRDEEEELRNAKERESTRDTKGPWITGRYMLLLVSFFFFFLLGNWLTPKGEK